MHYNYYSLSGHHVVVVVVVVVLKQEPEFIHLPFHIFNTY